MFTNSGNGDAATSEKGCSNNQGATQTALNSDVDRVINDLIREYGANAVIAAATRTISTLDEGAVKVRMLWQQVLETAMEVRHEQCGQSGASAGAHS
jgi:hypothetical protein